MRKALCLLALLASSVFILGATATPASATANCSFGQNANVRNGATIAYAASVYNCTDVASVTWIYAPGGGNPVTGWYDWACGCWAQGGLGFTLWGSYGYGNVAKGGPCVSACVAYVSQQLWFVGQCRDLQGRWYVKLLEASTGHVTNLITVVNPHQVICT